MIFTRQKRTLYILCYSPPLSFHAQYCSDQTTVTTIVLTTTALTTTALTTLMIVLFSIFISACQFHLAPYIILFIILYYLLYYIIYYIILFIVLYYISYTQYIEHVEACGSIDCKY